MTDHDQRTLPMLDENDFGNWKRRMRAYLMEYDVDPHLFDLKSPTGDELARFLTAKKKAAALLLQSLNMDQHYRFVTDKNQGEPRLLWTTISSCFESNARDNRARVYRRFLSLHCHSEDLARFTADIRRHLSEMSGVGLRVGNPDLIGCHLVEELVSEFILSKLPESLDHFRQIICLKRPLTIKYVTEQLERRTLNAGLKTNK